MCIGEAILRLRRERNLSRGDLAELLDVSRQSVSRWETGGAVLELDKPVRTPLPRRFFADANKHPAVYTAGCFASAEPGRSPGREAPRHLYTVSG